MNGNNILIYWGGSLIAATKSHSVHTECKTIEKSSTTQATWEECLAGRKKWSITVDYLVTNADGVMELLKAGNTYSLMVKGRGNGVAEIAGNAILKVCDQKYTRGALCVGTFQFQGTGALGLV